MPPPPPSTFVNASGPTPVPMPEHRLPLIGPEPAAAETEPPSFRLCWMCACWIACSCVCVRVWLYVYIRAGEESTSMRPWVLKHPNMPQLLLTHLHNDCERRRRRKREVEHRQRRAAVGAALQLVLQEVHCELVKLRLEAPGVRLGGLYIRGG